MKNLRKIMIFVFVLFSLSVSASGILLYDSSDKRHYSNRVSVVLNNPNNYDHYGFIGYKLGNMIRVHASSLKGKSMLVSYGSSGKWFSAHNSTAYITNMRYSNGHLVGLTVRNVKRIYGYK
jgi:hypothetical protein